MVIAAFALALKLLGPMAGLAVLLAGFGKTDALLKLLEKLSWRAPEVPPKPVSAWVTGAMRPEAHPESPSISGPAELAGLTAMLT